MAEIIESTYEILDQIGSGGGGNVYLANHVRLGKQVILKADKRKITTSPELLRREVDVLKDLSHPNIPHVYDYFIEDNTVYTAMEYIEGESLDRPLKRREIFSQPTVIKWAIQLLEALCYLHSPIHGKPPHGYVHSDIKPANLMLRPSGDICLIDFNIALAIGEENLIGGSIGYASPEHYGLNFSTNGFSSQTEKTEPLEQNRSTVLLAAEQPGSSLKRRIVPDARSDIYSTGATLYHLLCGRRPAKNALDVVPLSKQDFSPFLVDIITKSMNPNPDLRYQSAREMLEVLEHLHNNDPRMKRHKRRVRITAAILSIAFLASSICTFIGLRQMERMQAEAAAKAQTAKEEAQRSEDAARKAEEAERMQKTALAEISRSEEACRSGDVPAAISAALTAVELDTPYIARAQKALTDALGVYDLSDSFKPHLLLELPSEPMKVVLSPEGKRTGVMLNGKMLVFDTETGEQLAALPADVSALSEVVFSNEDTVLYAGDGALKAYDLVQNQELWSGLPATAIVLSADKKTAAAIYKDGNSAAIYDAASGEIRQTVDFQGQHQFAAANDLFADPGRNLLALNDDGTLLAVSFENGALRIYDLQTNREAIPIFEKSDYLYFEGGFNQQYFAFAARNGEQFLWQIIDTKEKSIIVEASPSCAAHVLTGRSGIYISNANVLVQIDPIQMVQNEAAYTDSDISGFSTNGRYTATALKKGGIAFFNERANLMGTVETGKPADFVDLAGDFVVTASRSAPSLRILKLDNHSENQTFSYDPDYIHSEARISAGGSTIMLFCSNGFRLYTADGNILADVDIPTPDGDRIYDQQFRREQDKSWLEVIYSSGLVRLYSAADGSVLEEYTGEAPDESLYEEFLTDSLRIERPLHGTPSAYDRDSGSLVKELESEDYLTYVTQVDDYIIMEYMTAHGERYGLLLNESLETLAMLPNLSDILENGELLFDDMDGNLRTSCIYSLQELISLAKS